MRFICQSDERLLIVGNSYDPNVRISLRQLFEGTALKPSFWNTPLEAPLPMPPQEQDLCRLPTRVAAFIGSAAGRS